MPNTLLLDREQWDCCLDAVGNIALATEPYARTQDVASRCRLFLGELYYDTTQGIRYFQQILWQQSPLAILKAQLAQAALLVPGVAAATVYLQAVTNREVRGQVQVTADDGTTSTVAI